jgi:hypothetical protein
MLQLDNTRAICFLLPARALVGDKITFLILLHQMFNEDFLYHEYGMVWYPFINISLSFHWRKASLETENQLLKQNTSTGTNKKLIN